MLDSLILIILIAFVSDEDHFDVLVGGEVLGLLEPLGGVVEGGEGGDVIDEDYSDGAPVVGAGD